MWNHLVDEQLLAIPRVLHLHLIVHGAIQGVEAGCEMVVVALITAHEHVVPTNFVVAFARLERRQVACAARLVIRTGDTAWGQYHGGSGVCSRVALAILGHPITNVDAAFDSVESGVEVDHLGRLLVGNAQSGVPLSVAGGTTARPAPRSTNK